LQIEKAGAMSVGATTVDVEAARCYHRKRDEERRAQREANRLQWLASARTLILRLAPDYPALQRVYLFGSITQLGRFRSDSDIDVVVEATDLESENAFWHALQRALDREVDVRPWDEAIISAVQIYGEMVYERKDHHPIQ
jgi:predicted nucleotidyltransferase